MHAKIEVESAIKRTPRVQQVESIFDVPSAGTSKLSWDVNLPLDERPWSIGLICGPSGCGKSTVARHLFGQELVDGYSWPGDASVLDGFPKACGIKDIGNFLSSVGFSSPPAWLRPFHALSNGEQFRVTMARVLAENPGLAVVDEFTSVVDRTVAKIGSAAIGKAVRRSGKKFVAVTCHADVEQWLQPDWVYQPAVNTFQWRSVQRRPPIDLVFNRAPASAWQLFKHHHYMSRDLHPGATCFVAFWGDTPVGFTSYVTHMGKLPPGDKAKRGHRLVVLPDYQGVGLGNALADFPASMFAGMGVRIFSGSSHPAVIAARTRSPNWRCTQKPAVTGRVLGTLPRLAKTRANTRMRASFEYCGPAMPTLRAEWVYATRCVVHG